jgi:hypothetical protein
VRIRPLHIVLITVAAGAVYAIISVVASFAEIKSVSEQVKAAAHAQAQRSPAAGAVAPPEATRGEAEPSGDVESPGSLDPIDPPEALREPSRPEERDDAAAEEIYDAVAEQVDPATEEAEERHHATRDLSDGSVDSELGDIEQDPGIETPDDLGPTLPEANDETIDAGAGFDER